MIGILLEHDEARNGLLQSGQTQSRIEQQRSDERDGFWKATVSRLHNDVSFIIGMNYAGLVDADDKQSLLDPNDPVHRRGVVSG